MSISIGMADQSIRAPATGADRRGLGYRLEELPVVSRPKSANSVTAVSARWDRYVRPASSADHSTVTFPIV